MSRKRWSDLDNPPLSQPILEIISTMGFDFMTPVQTAAIPFLLSLKDVSAEAVTGSGKTLAFLIPMIEILQKRHKEVAWKNNEIGAIVISPTRELALQISQVLGQFLAHNDLKHLKQKLIVGGNNIEEDIAAIKKSGPTILICTPGRLDDLFQRKSNLNLAAGVKSLEFLVLDEADRLLDLGFKTTISSILSYLPRQRRTGLFSATQTHEVTDLIRAGLRNPVLISVKEKSTISTPIKLQNFFKVIEADKKLIGLIKFLKSTKASHGKIMIFFPTCACVEYWLEILPKFMGERTVIGIHGKMKKKRTAIIESFRKENESILLCTDILARGLDVPEIDWVIQWDPPSNAASFVHRVGRTARQGNEGKALVFLLPSEDAYTNFLKINQKVELSELEDECLENLEEGFTETLHKIHEMQISDRSIFDKGVRAFVSHIQAYTKHECNAILRLKDVDFGKLATGYGLLQMPRMPELKNDTTQTFVGPSFDVDISKLRYRNPQKEKIRLEKLEVYKESGVWPGKKKHKKKSEAWGLAKKAKMDSKSKKELRKAKKLRKNGEGKDGTNLKSKKRKQKLSQDELNELAKDIRLFKRLKKNKISEEEFDKEIGLSD